MTTTAASVLAQGDSMLGWQVVAVVGIVGLMIVGVAWAAAFTHRWRERNPTDRTSDDAKE